MKVLIVDDNADNTGMLEALLRGSGYETAGSSNGKQALKILNSEKIDLIISDILMPVMDGFQLCLECKSDKKLAGIPFVFYTATYVEKKDEELALSLGAQKFIRKPKDPEKFLQIIREVLENADSIKTQKHEPAPRVDVEVLMLYNKRLVNKLEHKIQELAMELSERRRMEEALKEGEAKYRNLANSLPQVVCETDLKGMITYLNDNAYKVFGYSKTDLKGGLNIFRMLIPGDAERAAANFNKVLKGRRIHENEYTALRRNGTTFPVVIHTNLIKHDGKTEGLRGIVVDITDLKEAEQDLRNSEEYLRILFEYAPDAYYLNDLSGTFLDGNRASEELLGYTREELIGKNILKSGLVPVNQIEKIKSILVANNAGQATGPDELTLKRKNGSEVIVEIMAYPVKIKDQVQVLGIARDISNRKLAEEELKLHRENLEEMVKERTGKLEREIARHKKTEQALRKSEEKYRNIFESFQDIYYQTDRDGILTVISPSVRTIGGYEPEEVLGQPVSNFYPIPEERSTLLEQLNKKKKIIDYEIMLRAKDGRYVNTSINAKVICDPDGEFSGIQGVIRDITQRKQATEELRKLSEAIRHSQASIFITDTEGAIEYVNPSFTSKTGYSAEEVLGQNPRILNAGKTPKSYYKEMWDTIKAGNVWNGEFINRKKNGEIFTESILISPIFNEKGEITHFVAVKQDITERKELETQLIMAKQEAERANWAKSEFLANMSHEIRTPMNAVIGYADLMQPLMSDERTAGYLDSIITSGKGLLKLIDDILDLSRIESGKLDLQYEFIHSEYFFEEIKSIFAYLVEQKDLDFHLELSSGLPGGLNIDESRLRQVLVNLLGNAIKFTEKGYVKLSVWTENPKILEYSKDSIEEQIDLVMEVEDTGIGIPEESRDQIFESFRQQDGPMSKKYGGTGLGLAISKRLVELMNGSISVTSRVNEGSRFRVVIPEVAYLRDFERIDHNLYINVNDVAFDVATILVIDDVEHNRRYLADALSGTALKVMESDNGQAGYELALKHVPNIIIVDIRMPGMDGFEFLKKVKSNKKLKHIPVIAYSASVIKNQKERILKSDFAGFLMKPVQVAELYIELMNTLSHRMTGDAENEMDDPGKEKIPIEEILDHKQLINTLKKEMTGTWETFSKRQPRNEIRRFAGELVALGNKHNAGQLTDYGQKLIGAIDGFNVEKMLMLLKKFPVLVKNLCNGVNNRS